jgi:hypothetical protein
VFLTLLGTDAQMKSRLLSADIRPNGLSLDFRSPPRLLQKELVIPGGVRPVEVQRGVERLAAEASVLTVDQGELVLAPHVMQEWLGLHRGEHLQLRGNRHEVRLELRLSW